MGYTTDMKPRAGVRMHRGGCECGAVRYELELEPLACEQLAASDLRLRARRFTLLAGADAVSGHQFASSCVHHFYCERCGVCSFSRHNVEQDEAAFYAVDLRCLDLPRGCFAC
jgi:hypothetical protein